MQRSRLLSAAVVTVEELGWSGASVAHITARARVSRRTFYDLFDNREDCLLAIVNDVIARVADELATAGLEGMSWRERVRTGLWTILCFLDREPLLARVCVAHALQGGTRVLARREEMLAALAGELDRGAMERSSRIARYPSLTAEGLVGAVFSIVYVRLVRDGSREPLTGLFPELMGMIVLPYLGPAAARRERDRPVPALPSSAAGVARGDAQIATLHDPLASVPMRLTYRTARVLETIAEHRGVSNRIVGEHAGITDQGQISKLLARLKRLGLIENTGNGQTRGEANAWTLTPIGDRVVHSINAHTEGARQPGEGGGQP